MDYDGTSPSALFAQIIAYTPNKSSSTNALSKDDAANSNTFKVVNIQANVDIHISCAFVSIKFTYFNVNKTVVDGVFQFPTKNGQSIISDCEISFPKKCFAMSIVDPSNSNIQTLKENKQLRDLSNALKTRDMSVYDPNIFSMPFHSCPPNTQLVVELKYFQDLTFTPQGTYDITIPLSLPPHTLMYETMLIDDVVSITATIHPGSMNAATCQYGSNTHTLIAIKTINAATVSTDVSSCIQLKGTSRAATNNSNNNSYQPQDHVANEKILSISNSSTTVSSNNSADHTGDFNVWYQVRSGQVQATCLIQDYSDDDYHAEFDSNGDEKNKSKNKAKNDEDESSSSSSFILFIAPPSLPAVTNNNMAGDSNNNNDIMIASAPTEVLPRRVVFLLDHSGSMTGAPLSDAKRCLITALQHLQPFDEFTICAFDHEMIWFNSNGNNSNSHDSSYNNHNNSKGYNDDQIPTSAAVSQPQLVNGSEQLVQQACQWVESVRESGATDILTPYKLATECLMRANDNTNTSGSGFISMIVLITDGAVLDEVDICKYAESVVTTAVATAPTAIATSLNNNTNNTTSSSKYKILKSNKVSAEEQQQGLQQEQEYYPPSTVTAAAATVVIDGVVVQPPPPMTIRTHTFGIGPYCNRYFLKILAERGRGQSDVALYSDTLIAQMHAFMRKTQQPVVTDIAVQMRGVPLQSGHCYPQQPPDLSVGCPLIIAGTFNNHNNNDGKNNVKNKQNIPSHIQFSGRSATANNNNNNNNGTMMVYLVTIVSAPSSMPLRRLVEKIKLDYRIAEWWLEQRDTERQVLKQSIVQAAVQYQIPCAFTQSLAYEMEPADIKTDAKDDDDTNKINNNSNKNNNRQKNMTRAVLATGAVVLGTCIVAEFAFGSISATANNLGISQAMGSLVAGGFDSAIFSTLGAAFDGIDNALHDIDLGSGLHAIGSAAGTAGEAIGNVAGDAVEGVTHTFHSIDGLPNCNCCCCCCDIPCPFPSPLLLCKEHDIHCTDLPCCCCCPNECNDVCQQSVGALITASQFVFHFCSDNCAVCGDCECIGSVLGTGFGFFDNCACIGQLLGLVNNCQCFNDVCGGVCHNSCECVGPIIQALGPCVSTVIGVGGDVINTCCHAVQGCDNIGECGGMCVNIGGEVIRAVGPCIQSIGPIVSDVIGFIIEILR